MTRMQILATGAAAIFLTSVVPASAQIFLKSPDFSAAPVTGSEPGTVLPLPGAKPEEYRAAVLWSVRAGLNVAALQCQFEPTLLMLNQYNYLLSDHSAELTKAYTVLTAYFKRQNKSPKAAMNALDQYGTRTYSAFSTVRGQLGFCITASRLSRAALFTKRGQLTNFALNSIQQLRNSLKPAGEQQFPRFVTPYIQMVSFQTLNQDPKCYDKKGRLKKGCSMYN